MDTYRHLMAPLLVLALAGMSAAQSYKPFKSKPSCTIEPAAASQFCGMTGTEFTVTLTGKMGTDSTGPYTIRTALTTDQKIHDWRTTNPGFPAPDKDLKIRFKIKFRCLPKEEKCLVQTDKTLIESFEYDAGGGWKDMKGNTVVDVTNYETTEIEFTVDFGSKESKLDCKAKFACVQVPDGFGFGCPGSFGVPSMGYVGLPELGGVFTLQANNAAPASAAYLILGLSNTQWQGVPLPFPLGQLFPGSTCQLLVSPDLTLPMRTSNTLPGTVHFQMQLPRDPALTGLGLYAQWAIVDARARGGLAMTQGLKFHFKG